MALNKDEFYIKKCFELAKKAGLNTLPNPLVGCVIVKNDKIISKGYHKKYGEFHAERNAILSAKESVQGATLYCNLEPCSHFGKTPPCVDLIIEKKIKRVVYSIKDKNPLVDSKKKLQDAGIEVIVGILEEEAKELNKVFFKNITQNLPYVYLKSATTLDGKTATTSFNSKWVTGETSRHEVQNLRSSIQAIMTGSNTVKFDNPKLTCRIEGHKNPVRIIIDRKGILKDTFNVFKNNARVIVACNTDRTYPPHVEKVKCKNLKTLLKNLYKKGIYSIVAESGGALAGALLKEKLVDEVYQFLAPKILGGGLSFIRGLDPVKMGDCILARDLKIKNFGEDILLNYKLVYDKKKE